MVARRLLLGDDVDVVIGMREHADQCSALSAREKPNSWGRE
jgi:hypothetical protein